jgi:hypothetical protein
MHQRRPRISAFRPVIVAVALALAAAPSAFATEEIPLDGAISEQYHEIETAVDDAQAAVDAEVAAALDAAAPAAEPEPVQYQPEMPIDNSETTNDFMSETASAPAPAEPVPSEPAPAETASAEPAAPDPVPAEPEAPEVESEVELPARGDAVAGNVNISIRILSPGDDGPVTQVTGGSAPTGSGAGPVTSTPVAPAPAPATWIWNWNWDVAPDCSLAGAGNMAPPVGEAGWTWNWDWSCGGELPTEDLLPEAETFGEELTLPAAVALPAELALSDVEMPDLAIRELVADVLPAGAIPVATGDAGAGVQGGAAPARSQPQRATPPAPVLACGAPCLPAAASILTPVAPVPPTTVAADGAHDPAPARRQSRDITETSVVPPLSGPTGVAPAAAASAAAAAGAGGAAVLATLLCLLASFLARTLLPAVGLPRSRLWAARLERPG